MILQIDRRLRTAAYAPSGCYLFAICFHVNRLVNYPFSVGRLDALYGELLAARLIDPACFVLDPAGVFAALGLPVWYSDRYEPPGRLCAPGEFEILHYVATSARAGAPADGWQHYVDGDGAGHVTYDPMGVSRAVRDGRLADKRIFRRK